LRARMRARFDIHREVLLNKLNVIVCGVHRGPGTPLTGLAGTES
jgi:hypothetical protein